MDRNILHRDQINWFWEFAFTRQNFLHYIIYKKTQLDYEPDEDKMWTMARSLYLQFNHGAMKCLCNRVRTSTPGAPANISLIRGVTSLKPAQLSAARSTARDFICYASFELAMYACSVYNYHYFELFNVVQWCDVSRCGSSVLYRG